jgi:hypothetical protein
MALMSDNNDIGTVIAAGCVGLGLTLIAWAAFAALITFVVLFVIHHA